MEKTDAISIENFIKDIFFWLSFDSKKLRGQRYDGCTAMMGKKKGVDTQIKNDIQPFVLSTHNHAQSLNLACDDWIRNEVVVSKSLDTSYEIIK